MSCSLLLNAMIAEPEKIWAWVRNPRGWAPRAVGMVGPACWIESVFGDQDGWV